MVIKPRRETKKERVGERNCRVEVEIGNETLDKDQWKGPMKISLQIERVRRLKVKNIFCLSAYFNYNNSKSLCVVVTIDINY